MLVCGLDGVEYFNECYFKVKFCFVGGVLVVVNKGLCGKFGGWYLCFVE